MARSGTPRPRQRSTAKGVKRLPASSFAYPKTRQYPINTRKRARAALAYSARKDTSGSYSVVRAKVAKRYPDIARPQRRRTGRRRR